MEDWIKNTNYGVIKRELSRKLGTRNVALGKAELGGKGVLGGRDIRRL